MVDNILKTVCYADLFDYSLTPEQVYSYLISDRVYSKREVEKGINLLIHQGKLIKNSIKGTNYINLITLSTKKREVPSRFSRRILSAAKLEKTRNAIRYLYSIPSLSAVFVTGSLAMDNADENDDIDLMLVCQTKQLWLTRFQVTLLLETLSLRRKPETQHRDQSISDKFCPNLYLDSSHLALSKARQNLYVAHELVQAKVLFDKANIRERLFDQNRWLYNYLPHSPLLWPVKGNQMVNKQLANSNWVNWFEKGAYFFQKWYMNSKITREIISPKEAFFHPRNTQDWVLREYQNRLNKYLQ